MATNHNSIQIEQSKQARQHFWKEIADSVAAVFASRLLSLSFDRVTEHENAVI
jgi:hypothetical protein